QPASARRVTKQTPGKSMGAILIEMGTDEGGVRQAVAEIARLPLGRVDPTGVDSFDRKSLRKLGADYCKTNLVLPIRREGSRLVVGTTNPDDVFLLDDVKRKLGVPAIKHVRSEEHTSELQSRENLVCRLLLE